MPLDRTTLVKELRAMLIVALVFWGPGGWLLLHQHPLFAAPFLLLGGLALAERLKRLFCATSPCRKRTPGED